VIWGAGDLGSSAARIKARLRALVLLLPSLSQLLRFPIAGESILTLLFCLPLQMRFVLLFPLSVAVVPGRGAFHGLMLMFADRSDVRIPRWRATRRTLRNVFSDSKTALQSRTTTSQQDDLIATLESSCRAFSIGRKPVYLNSETGQPPPSRTLR
jgi:hypothetical protein